MTVQQLADQLDLDEKLVRRWLRFRALLRWIASGRILRRASVLRGRSSTCRLCQPLDGRVHQDSAQQRRSLALDLLQ